MWNQRLSNETLLSLLVLLSMCILSQSFSWNIDYEQETEVDPFDMGTYDPSSKYDKAKNLERRLHRRERNYVEVKGSNEDKKDENNFDAFKGNVPNEKRTLEDEKEVVEELIVKQVAWTVCKHDECDKVKSEATAESSKVARDTASVSNNIAGAQLTASSIKDSQSSAKTYVRRIVKRILGAIKVKSSQITHGTIEVPLIAKLNTETLKQLEDFVSTDDSSVNLNSIDSIMSELFHKGNDCILDKKYCFEVDSWRSFFSSVKTFFVDLAVGNLDIWLALTFILAVVLVALFASRRSPLYASVVLLGIAFLGMSWYSHYQLLLQKAMAKRQSDMARMSTIPVECRPHEMQMHQTIWHWTKTNIFMADDPCDKYHEVLLVDYTLEVTAVIALWDLFATVVFHPLDHVGKKAGQFFFHFLGNLSLVKGVVVIVFMSLMSMFVLILFCGYQIRFPFWLGGIEPAIRQYQPPPPQRIEDIREQVRQEVFESLTTRLSALQLSNRDEPIPIVIRRRPRRAGSTEPSLGHRYTVIEDTVERPSPEVPPLPQQTFVSEPPTALRREDLTPLENQVDHIQVSAACEIMHGAFVIKGGAGDREETVEVLAQRSVVIKESEMEKSEVTDLPESRLIETVQETSASCDRVTEVKFSDDSDSDIEIIESEVVNQPSL